MSPDATGRVVVLDDDPTGTQSVHGLDMLLTDIGAGLESFAAGAGRATYVLTNTRAMSPDDAAGVVRRIVSLARDALGDPLLVLRGDSTLRGHVALEMELLGLQSAVGIVVPAFPDGGRTTLGGVHRVRTSAGEDVPVGETEFARDPVFGFTSSRLADWAGAAGLRGAKHEIPLDDLRATGGGAVLDLLRTAADGAVVLPDATTDDDIALIAGAVQQARAAGRRVVVRCASPLAAALAGSSPLLVRPPRATQVLVACGSHTDGAAAQLAHLDAPVRSLPDVDLLLAGAAGWADELIERLRADLRETGLAVVASPRLRAARHGSLAHGAAVMEALVQVVAALAPSVDVVVSKGGITSADIATRALAGRRARVLGQVAVGIPIWRVEGTRGSTTQVVVPGNVGGPTALAEIVHAVMPGATQPPGT